MTKGRKTTAEEHIQIVDHCLKHRKYYQATAETDEVSYQQVYQWVKKFEAAGEEGLRDRRGRTKEEFELTAEEKLQLEIKRITKADHVAENILNRESKADYPNEKWCTDVTEFIYGVGKKLI